MNQYENEILKKLKYGKQALQELKKELQNSDEFSFSNALNTLEKEGKIFFDGSEYEKIQEGYYVGEITISKDGEGYVNISEKTYKIKKGNLNGALPHDLVLIKKEEKERYGQQIATVEKVIQRKENQIYKLNQDGFWDVYGVNSCVRLKLPKNQYKCDVEGTLIMAKIDENPLINYEGELIFEGTFIKEIGHISDPKGQIKIIGAKYGFDYEFNDKELKEAKNIQTSPKEEDYIDRVDLRKEKIFTIDGKDTKDMDDAVSIIKDGENYILKVHIADVSHYIKKGTHLDKGAKQRGNSAYLSDSVFPMFPRNISNGICSLNEGEDRLTKTVEMKIDKEGNIIDSKIYKSIINSNKKMSYEDINELFEGKEKEAYAPYKDDLALMRKLSHIITRKRKSKGSLDFYSRELKIKEDEKGTPIDIKSRHQNEAEKLIENFMIYANVTVANHFGYLNIPFVFRVHENPDAIKLQNTLNLIKEQNIIQNNKSFDNLLACTQRVIEGKKANIKPEEMYAFLSSIKEKPYYEAISNELLRCMKRAKYYQTNEGHFGLSEDTYCHFTSPIRRYADLMVHRIIDYMLELYKAPLNTEEILENIDDIQKEISSICEHISEQEKRADEAEKESDELKSIEYFENNIEDLEGPIKAKILHINRLGLTLIVNDLFTVKVDSSVLINKGYTYKRESHTYVNKKEALKLGDTVYLFNPEVSKEYKTIKYNDINKKLLDFDFEKPKQKTIRRKTSITAY